MVVFFSYARPDDRFALRLASDLRDAGVELWIDQLDIRSGEHWDSAVETALKRCPAFLIILSQQSVLSRNVMDEVHYTLEEGKKIIPIMHQVCDLPFRLRRVQYIDFTNDYEKSLKVCSAHLSDLFAINDKAKPRTLKNTERRTGEQEAGISVIRTQSRERLDGIRILWVDDRPWNNRYERKALEELGAEIHLAIDTDDAFLIAQEIEFKFFISDMARPSGRRAGYALLSKLQQEKMRVPFVIYSSSRDKHKQEAIELGAVGSTNNPYELIDLVLKHCEKSKDTI